MKTLTRNLDTLILAIAIILVWRGVWGLADLYLFPSMPVLSFTISILSGIIILFVHNLKKQDISELL